MDNNFNEEEVAKKIQERIEQLNKESFAIDLCRGKGVTLDKMTEIGDRQREIEAELSKLKAINVNSNEPGAVSSHEEEKKVCEHEEYYCLPNGKYECTKCGFTF